VTSNEEAGAPKKGPATPRVGEKDQVLEPGKGEGQEVWSPGLAYQARLRELEERYKDVDERYKGYEVLLDDGGVTGDIGVTIPTGVCANAPMCVCVCMHVCVHACVCAFIIVFHFKIFLWTVQ